MRWCRICGLFPVGSPAGFWILSHGFCLGKNRYTGQFSWHGPKVTGQCQPVKCHGERLNGKPGPKCRCADGYAGMPLFKFHYQPRRPQPGSSSSVYFDSGKFLETCTPPKCPIPTSIGCTPAECTIPNSIGKGPECRCADKFVGNITWKGALVSGRCVPAACKFFHSNNKPGPDCACAFGYEQVGPISQPVRKPGKLLGVCQKIPCLGDFSNHQGGPGCRCADGYNGTVQLVTMVETRFSAAGPASRNFTAFNTDSCMPAKCSVENTIGDGPECRCKDGYQGSVTWMGTHAIGTCKPANCFIEKSNGKPGPQCSCLDGYHGSILTDVGSHSSASLLGIKGCIMENASEDDAHYIIKCFDETHGNVVQIHPSCEGFC